MSTFSDVIVDFVLVIAVNVIVIEHRVKTKQRTILLPVISSMLTDFQIFFHRPTH